MLQLLVRVAGDTGKSTDKRKEFSTTSYSTPVLERFLLFLCFIQRILTVGYVWRLNLSMCVCPCASAPIMYSAV